jgi:F-type H+-transporting ATPase subunit delta
MQLLRILLVKRREEEFPAIREEFIRIRRFEGRVLYAEISSSEPLSPEHKTSLLEKLAKIAGKAVEPDFVVNPNLIGGVKVSYDNYVLDGSIRGGLNRLRDALRYDLLKQN